MSNHSKQPRKHLGLEAALEQDRLELLNVHNNNSTGSRRLNHHISSGPSGATHRTHHRSTATAPVRNPYDPSPGALPPRHGSIAGIGVGVTPPSTRGFSVHSSWNEPATSPLRVSSSAATSPTSPDPSAKEMSEDAPRRASDGTDLMMSNERKSRGSSPAREQTVGSIRNFQYEMEMLEALEQGSSRRLAQSQVDKPPSKAVQSRGAMAAVMSGLDPLRVGLPSFARGRDSGRRNSTRGTSLDSRFPRFGRSSSPVNRQSHVSNHNHANNIHHNHLKQSTRKLSISDKGKPLIDMDKHISDEALSGSLASSLHRPASRRTSAEDGMAGSGRLEKDNMYDSENNPIDTSEEEIEDSTSSEDEAGSSVGRGRKISVSDLSEEGEETDPAKKSGVDEEEEEDDEIADKLNDTSISDIKPVAAGTTTKTAPPMLDKPAKRPEVHPRTSYESASAINTPFGSDDEAELSDIKRAQKLSIQMSSINNSVQNRTIRTIIRGNYTTVPEEVGGARHRQRSYLVATDLSEESVYALEWTIGTILRDGDTMFAVCSVHEETAAGTSAEGAKAMADATAAVVGSQTEETVLKSMSDASLHLPRALFGRFGTGSESKPSSADTRGMTKSESDRVRACEAISQTCVRLLRKTALQVRIAVEVIHCKSPKHMITEAIDGLEPTLVIVGARGRSALKGVLLGSFSNYLVTNSSVPVMVVRKKLKKQTKNKKTNIRLSNNLTTPKKLALAKID